MFCSNCGKSLMDGTRFCQYCGTPVRTSGAQNRQGAASGQRSAAPGQGQVPGQSQSSVQGQASGQSQVSGQSQMSGRAGMTGQKNASVQYGPAHIRPAARTASDVNPLEKKKKKPIGLIIAAAVAVVAVIFGVSQFNKPPEDFVINTPPGDIIIPGEGNNNRKTITVDASKQGEALAPSMDSYGDTSDAIEDFGKRLAQSGAEDAARDVYSMVPKAELAQAARDQTEKLEDSDNGPVQVYNMYKDVKKMFTSIYGEEGGR